MPRHDEDTAGLAVGFALGSLASIIKILVKARTEAEQKKIKSQTML